MRATLLKVIIHETEYTEKLHYQPGLSTLAGWNLNSPKSVC